MKLKTLLSGAAFAASLAAAGQTLAHDERSPCLDPTCEAVALFPLADVAAGGGDLGLTPPRFGTWGFDASGMDMSVKPGDDMYDYGAHAFVGVIRQIRRQSPSTKIEVLTPDFRGQEMPLAKVIAERPDVFNHNVEVVPRLYTVARRGSTWERSNRVLRNAAAGSAIVFPALSPTCTHRVRFDAASKSFRVMAAKSASAGAAQRKSSTTSNPPPSNASAKSAVRSSRDSLTCIVASAPSACSVLNTDSLRPAATTRRAPSNFAV